MERTVIRTGEGAVIIEFIDGEIYIGVKPKIGYTAGVKLEEAAANDLISLIVGIKDRQNVG